MRFSASPMIGPVFGGLATCMRAGLVLLAVCLSAKAERPSAMKLFPEETSVFIRLKDAHEFGEKFQQTSMGRMIKDPQLKPFVESLYGKAGDLYAEHAEEKVGISWEDLKKLPKGEVAFGVIGRERGAPALLLLIDQGDEVSVADKLVDKALDLAEQKGGEFSKEKVGDVDITVVRDPERKNRMFGLFERDNTIVVATDPMVLRNVLWHWDHADEPTPSAAASGESAAAAKTDSEGDEASKDKKPKEAEFVPTRTLAENTRFATIVKECRRKQDPPPQLIFYVDPIGLAKKVARGDGGMQMVMAMLPMLGLDGLSGIGGAITYATDEYDDLVQVHVLLENPRSGILQLPAFEAGETTPQPFVPKDIETYLAWNLNLGTTYDRVLALAERFGARPAIENFVKEKIDAKFGIDIKHQIIENLKGRYSWMIGYDTPARVQGRQNVLAAELKDEKAVTEALKTVIGKYPEQFEEKRFGNVTYYAIVVRPFKDMPEDKVPIHPFVAVTDGNLFLGTSIQQFERCITARDGTAERLVDSDDYKRTSAVIGRETAGKTPVLFSMNRMEAMVRQWYDVLTSPKTREQLEENKAKNPILAALAETLEKNQLPPFDVLVPYFAPGGGIMYDTDNGYHGISFSLRNGAEK